MLVKSVLGSMGLYYMSVFLVPVKVVKEFESIRANFFWGGNEDKR